MKNRIFFIIFSLGSLLLSCQQLVLKNVSDYSKLLPKQQLLYLSLQQTADFRFLPDGQLQNFVGKRLQRSQLAIGPQGELYIINQLVLNEKLFERHIARRVGWQSISRQLYLRSDGYQALQMPEPNLLYLSQGLAAEDQIREQREFFQLWRKGTKRNSLPRRFHDLLAEQPVVAYSPRVIPLIISPWLQKIYPRALHSFARISKKFPLSQMLLWVETVDKKQYTLHLELATTSLLLSKGLEAGFRLFLPSLILRSQQEFIRRQLANVRLESSERSFRLQMPMNRASLLHILGQFQKTLINF